MKAFEMLCEKNKIDVNHYDCVGKTAAMYLVENGKYREIKTFVKKYNIDPNYKNKYGESLVSIYVKRFYQQYIGNIGTETNFLSKYNYVITKNYPHTLKSLIDLCCDFNVLVDEDGNTAIMAFLLMKDYITTKYLLDNLKILTFLKE